MSVPQTADVTVDARRRRIKFRSWHRGMLETDLLLGRFADAEVERLSEKELDDFEALLEALDRDVRKAHEQPSIGVLLCASKEDKVVEYALNRTLSPALIAEYQTMLPDKKLLQDKLNELYSQNAREEDEGIRKPKAVSRRKRPV